MPNDHDVPRELPPVGRAVLENLTWRRAAGRNPPAHLFTTRADAVTARPVRDEIREIAAVAMANR